MVSRQDQITAEVLKNAERLIENQNGALEQAENQIEYLQEQYVDAVRAILAAEDVGWNLLGGGGTQDFLNLGQLHTISRQLREWSKTNALLVRGHEIRSSYLYSSGYTTVYKDGENVPPRHKNIIEDPVNQDVVFSLNALKTLERARFTDGQVFVTYNSKTKQYGRVPFRWVQDAVFDPDDPEKVWYYQLGYTRELRPLNAGPSGITPEFDYVWYKSDLYNPGPSGFVTSIGGNPVDPDVTIIADRVNRSAGDTWGVPDSFAAAPWALGYSSYLRDGTKVLSALAEYAWKISPKTVSGMNTTKAKLADPTQSGSKAKTAVTDMSMQSLPRANAVDLGTGEPLAAQVASALGISTGLLLSDASVYGNTQVLSDPTIKTMLFRQDEVSQFMRRLFAVADMGEVRVVWGKMAGDADFREAQSLAVAWDTGLFHEDEIRQDLAKLLKIKLTHKKAPKKVLIPNNSTSDAEIDLQTQLARILAKNNALGEAAGSSSAPPPVTGTPVTPQSTVAAVTGQGRGGRTAKSVSAGSNDLRDADSKNS